ncbi:protein phosphatase 1 regulatory subunit 12C-like, partial [Orbicella faveolata]|uniref:protein phosphatase 1 regulatory subunit 12C-like n=1 Tax=Orbicella faveolata TaxID=48498 RepID=UPI0009E58FD6
MIEVKGVHTGNRLWLLFRINLFCVQLNRAVEKLLAKAGDILNVAKSDGFTTLHIAAINDHREIAKILLKQPGCDVNALTVENQSALHLATNEGYSDMVEILLDHGADVNSVDKDGDTALHIALAKESLVGTDLMSQMPSLQLLLRVHGDSRSYATVTRCLLSYGADVFKVNGRGETPLHRCQGSEVEHLIREIAASGGTSQIRKVPSFGATNPSSNRQIMNSTRLAKKAGGTQRDVERNKPSTSEANSKQEDINEDNGDITVQDQPVQATEGQENQGEEDDQGAVNVAMDEDVNIVENSVDGEPSYQENIVLEVTNQVQEEPSDTEVLNNSTDEDVAMAVDNEVAENDHSLGPDLETQADGNDEHMDQAKEIIESENLLSCNEQ